MEENRRNGLVRALKRFVLAYDSFQRVIALCDHLREFGVTAKHPIYTPCVAGIATTYMKAFVESEGMGPLPSEFKEIHDPRLKNAHDRLEESRHKIYAHRDVSAAASLKYDHPIENVPYTFTIELSKEHAPTYHVDIPDLNPEIGSDVRDLCVFQSKRTTDKMTETINKLVEGKSYKAGHYTLGENFP